MRFGQPAIAVAGAPMDFETGGMSLCVKEISVGKAPIAMAVTAMRIGRRKKGKGEGARCGPPPRAINYRTTSDGAGAGGSAGGGVTGLSSAPPAFFRPFLAAELPAGPRPRNGSKLNAASVSLSFP